MKFFLSETTNVFLHLYLQLKFPEDYYYNQQQNQFQVRKGPIFANFVLADEINRAPAKVQSALLEAMEEQNITVEGKTYPLPNPFFVIATQNPSYQIGTFPLPESQLDRFLMRIELGYPDQDAERLLLKGESRHRLIEALPVMLTPERLINMQHAVTDIYVSNAVLDYCQAIIRFTRESSEYHCGLSPRAGLALLNAAKAWAFMDQRDAVIPEDIQAVLAAVAGHRLRSGNNDSAAIVAPILAKVAIR